MLLISLNENNNDINLVSFQRDLYLPLYGQDMTNRLNASYTYGGPLCTIRTIEEAFKIKIPYYVVIDMYSSYTFLDAIGGVDIDVSSEEIAYINSYLNELNIINGFDTNDSHLSEYISGKQHLNGKQALSYCRIRYLEGDDYGRTNRQRNTIIAIAKQLGSLSLKPHKWKSTYNALLDASINLTTNMTSEDMLHLLSKLPLAIGAEQYSYSIPADKTWSYHTTDSGMEVITCNLEQNHHFLQQKLY